MIRLSETTLGDGDICPYLPDRTFRSEYFFASFLTAPELEIFLSQGWRKFGLYYFRPKCPGCSKCIPLRIPVGDLSPTKSQRRALRAAENLEVHFGPLEYRREIFDIYEEHSLDRFGESAVEEHFIQSFFQPSCPALQSEYYLDGKLVAVGFLDYSDRSFSSVYFIYRSEIASLRPGIVSVFHETAEAKRLGLEYYYLGYYIEENHRMEYKGHFSPHERYSWEDEEWIRYEK